MVEGKMEKNKILIHFKKQVSLRIRIKSKINHIYMNKIQFFEHKIITKMKKQNLLMICSQEINKQKRGQKKFGKQITMGCKNPVEFYHFVQNENNDIENKPTLNITLHIFSSLSIFQSKINGL